MARYKIDAEGAASLNQLAKDLYALNDDLETSSTRLKNAAAVLEGDLGIYEVEISNLVSSVAVTQVKGREAVEQLAASIKEKAVKVQALINAGLG